MLKYGSSVDATGSAVCAVKQWPEVNCTGGYLLFVYGTQPDPISVCPDSHRKCLRKTEANLQGCLEQLSKSGGKADHAFAAAVISDAIQRTNAQIHEIAAYLGQSICIGGVIAFFHDTHYIIVPFGGGDTALWSQQAQSLTHIGDPVTNDYVTTNPIGGHSTWTGKYWNGTLAPDTRLLLCSNPLRATPEILDKIRQGCQPESHDDTLALLLRQTLERNELPPVAVLDFHD